MIRPLIQLLASAIVFLPTVCSAFTLVWPTPNTAFSKGESIEYFIQPTASGEILSGTFGAVRNNGYRFHEGLDLKPVLKRTRKGEPTDPVYAAMDGVVASISSVAGNSSYGRYIVITHEMNGVQFYTLYAHLAAIGTNIRRGTQVSAGTAIGTMGRSAGGYGIPRDRAHLHFEIGLKYGNSFQRWYDRQQFGSPNYQGNFNGMNLEGFDPLAFFNEYKAGNLDDISVYIRKLQPAYVLRVNTNEIPLIAQQSPGLLSKPMPDAGLAGWDITFTWYGVPTLFTPLTQSDLTSKDAPDVVRLKAVNRAVIANNHCKSTVKMKNGQPAIYSGAMDILELMFGHKMGVRR